MSNSAILVVDMQRAALDGCPDAAGVIGRINDLTRRATEAGVPVIFIQHEDDEYVRGTPGWELAEDLDRPDGSHLVEKTYRDGFEATELEPLLERLGVRRLVVTGVHSDYCVQMTALSAVVRGFDLALVSDAHAAEDDDAALPAQTVTAFVNARMSTLRSPGRTIEVLPAAEVSF